MSDATSDGAVAASVKQWVEGLVVAHNLCPFARRELEANRVRYRVTAATDEEQLLRSLAEELGHLQQTPEVETTLLIHPQVLENFIDYNQFLSLAETLLEELALDGIFQVASFHPDYQFAGTEPGDAENYSNRSPYPMLHILREQSVTRAVDGHPDVESIPDRNIAHLEAMGSKKLAKLLRDCYP